MPIHRTSNEKIHTFLVEDVMKYDLPSAIILSNIDKFKDVAFEDLHMKFPYFIKEDFYRFLSKLISYGEIQISEN